VNINILAACGALEDEATYDVDAAWLRFTLQANFGLMMATSPSASVQLTTPIRVPPMLERSIDKLFCSVRLRARVAGALFA
jgi:hypothetical protein